MTFALVGPLCCCLLAAAPAKGTKLEQGQKAFASGDYSGALKALDVAAVEGTDLERVQLLRAQCFAAQQDFARAEEAFALALEANPEASLDPTRVDPSVVKVLDGLRARTRGTLVVRSTPPGAEVTLDGKVLGPAPLETSIVIGRHKLEAKWPVGGSVASTELLVRARRETYLEWVQGAVTNNPIEREGPGVHPYGEARGLMEVGGGVVGGFELGGGVELSYFRIGLDLRLAPFFGLTPRAGLVVPLLPILSAFVEVELPVIFPSRGSAIGIGGEGGVEWHPLRFLGFFVALGGRHYFDNPVFIGDSLNRFTLSAGLRVRVP